MRWHEKDILAGCPDGADAARWLGPPIRGRKARVIVTTDGEADAKPGDTIHFVCTVTDDGTPALTRYARVVVTVR